MAWIPTGAWKRDFRKALKGAFTNVYQMEMLVDDYFAPESFTNIAPVGPGVNFEFQISQLINQALMEDWLLDLVAAAQEARSGHSIGTELDH